MVLVSGSTILCCAALQPVPITGRRQLDFIPRWVANKIEDFQRAEEDKEREALKMCSWGSDHPGMQGATLMFNRLVYTSGLDDRDWDFRVVLAPSE